MFRDIIVCLFIFLFVYDLMMMNFIYRYAHTKKHQRGRHSQTRTTPRDEFVCSSTKELAKSTSYSVRVSRGRCDDSA